jgi:ubiquitin fusion degradation protein 1
MFFMNRFDYEEGDKIILPSNYLYAFIHLMESGEPLTFRITCESGKQYHCGVIEFSSSENVALIPSWLLRELGLTEGSFISIDHVILAKAKKVCIQPKTQALFQFVDIKSALEQALKTFTCLTKDTTIKIRYETVDIELYVKDVFPEPNVSLHNTDCEVEFIEPSASSSSTIVARPVQPAKRQCDASAQQHVSRIGSNYSRLTKQYSAFSGKPNKLA